MVDELDRGVSPDGAGLSSDDGAASVSTLRASIPDATLDAVALAIEHAHCPGREGPYGGYDYGYNTEFYGPEPEQGRYVVRDFRDPRSPNWGSWVYQTHDREEYERAFQTLTGRHIAEAAINAYTQGIAARSDETRSGSAEGKSPVPAGDAPDTHSDTGEQANG